MVIKKRGHSRSEWSGVFEGPSSSSLGSGATKMPPVRTPGAPRFFSELSCHLVCFVVPKEFSSLRNHFLVIDKHLCDVPRESPR
jgi:hypothetical protein